MRPTNRRGAPRRVDDRPSHFESVVSALREGVIVRDVQGRVVSCNPAAERMLGLGLPDWRGRAGLPPGWSARHPDGTVMPIDQTPTARVLGGGPPELEVIQCLENSTGRRVLFQVNCMPVHVPAAGPLALVVTSFIDVTFRRGTQAAAGRDGADGVDLDERSRHLRLANDFLVESARFNRMVADANPGGVSYWDRHLHCRLANRSFAESVARLPEDLIGLALEDCHDAANAVTLRAHLLRALAGEPQHFTRDRVLQDGRAAVEEVSCLPDEADARGEVIGVYVMSFDITLHKHAERELNRANDAMERARDQAESATRAKSSFLANTSHEIRTPLNAILGLTFLMTRESRDARQTDRLGKVSTAAHHLLDVINDILDLSKIDAGKFVLDLADFSVDDLMTRSREMVAGTARDKGLELILDSGHLPALLRGDATRLSQIFINLLANAVKFTEHGWVRLRGEIVEEQPRRILVRFEVKDTGPGIAKEQQAALFNAFEQVDSSASRHHGGTGLGLALTRQLATAMGGEAGLVSAPGSGSAFWFTAWLDRAAATSIKSPRSLKTGLRVLLVDDLAEAREVIGARLRMMGLVVDAVETGAEAIAKAHAAAMAGRPHELLMIDWRMSPMDGIETLAAIRARLGDATPPGILVTASDDADVLERAIASRFSATMLKPVTASALQDTIAHVLHGRQGAPPRASLDASDAERLLRTHFGGRRVLLAEDNPINRLVAEELLRGAGLVVETANDGSQAIQMALSRVYDIAFLDVQMPLVDGLDATRAIRAAGMTGLPVIAMTANAFVEDRAECLAAGMNDHVAKPVEPALLFAMALHWLPLSISGAMPAGGAARPIAPAADKSAMVARLEAIAGFDVALALRQVGGHPNLLARVLSRFIDAYRGGLPELLNLSGSDADRRERWGAVCHSVRGALDAVGATEAAKHVMQLERQLHADAPLPALVAAAHTLHLTLLDFVQQLARELEEPPFGAPRLQ